MKGPLSPFFILFIMIKNILFLSVLIYLSIFSVNGQTASVQPKKKKELVISFGPSTTRIKNENTINDENKNIDNKNGFNMDICYNRYASAGVAFGIGLGYSTYDQIIYQKGLFEHFSQTDKDGNLYDEWIDSDMTYTNKISTLDIPLKLHVLLGSATKYDAFFDLGVINQFLITGNSTEKGSIENMGKYPSSNPYFNIVSQSNSYYDYKITLYDKKYNDRYNFYNLSGHFAAGLAVKMSEITSFKVQAYVNIGFSDVTAKEFRDMDYQNVIGLKEDYEKTTLFATGLNVGFVFKLGN